MSLKKLVSKETRGFKNSLFGARRDLRIFLF